MGLLRDSRFVGCAGLVFRSRTLGCLSWGGVYLFWSRAVGVGVGVWVPTTSDTHERLDSCVEKSEVLVFFVTYTKHIVVNISGKCFVTL